MTDVGGRRPTRVAMIGTGAMAESIADDFALAGMDLVAVAGRDAARTRAFAQSRGIPGAWSVPEIWTADLDLVYVATTHDSHRDLAVQALEAGYPVLVEKAFTMDAAQARELIDLSARTGLFLMEAMWMRFTPAVRLARRLIAEGAIGDPRAIQATFGFSLPAGDHRLRDPARGGGTLLDQGVYPLAFADTIFGSPSSVSAVGSSVDAQGVELDVETELAVLLGYPDGRQAMLASSFRSTLPSSATVNGPRGRIELDAAFWCSQRLRVHRPDADPEIVDLPHEGNGYVPMLRAVDEALAAGWREHPLADHASTLRVMELVDLVRRQLSSPTTPKGRP